MVKRQQDHWPGPSVSLMPISQPRHAFITLLPWMHACCGENFCSSNRAMIGMRDCQLGFHHCLLGYIDLQCQLLLVCMALQEPPRPWLHLLTSLGLQGLPFIITEGERFLPWNTELLTEAGAVHLSKADYCQVDCRTSDLSKLQLTSHADCFGCIGFPARQSDRVICLRFGLIESTAQRLHMTSLRDWLLRHFSFEHCACSGMHELLLCLCQAYTGPVRQVSDCSFHYSGRSPELHFVVDVSSRGTDDCINSCEHIDSCEHIFLALHSSHSFIFLGLDSVIISLSHWSKSLRESSSTHFLFVTLHFYCLFDPINCGHSLLRASQPHDQDGPCPDSRRYHKTPDSSLNPQLHKSPTLEPYMNQDPQRSPIREPEEERKMQHTVPQSRRTSQDDSHRDFHKINRLLYYQTPIKQ